MKHAITETNNGSRLIDAQGHLIKTADADRRLLHVLPKLYVDAPVLHRFMRPEHVRLSVAADQPELNHLQPPGGSIQVTQCVPNKGYFIGGCQDTRYGWFVRLPDDLDVIDLVFHWDIAVDAAHLRQRIEHEISLKLLPGPYHTWSMDLSAWHRVRRFEPGKPPLVFQPTTLLSGAGFNEGRNVEVIDICFGDSEDGDLFVYAESLEIPAIPFSDLAYIEEFQDKRLHEVSRQSLFTLNNDAHRANADLEMPADLFVCAVRVAIETPFDRDNEPHGVSPSASHPAIQMLAAWWNVNSPNRCASFLMPWVRVEDSASEYWCGYYETPNEPFALFAQDKDANARVGDAIILQFMRQIAVDDARLHEIAVFLVNGNLSHSVGGVGIEEVKSGEYDEAWYGLEALRRFPSRFPEIWGALTEETME
ncbi:hypothetical protein [Acidithiobacillus ferrianus]|uniref:hypothetical protein n=1 Tax=Acidithiobacillus ferrianus TaxID=2678518 RepID=UPI0034E4B354